MEEQSYFFRLAKYRQPLLDLMERQPEICMPDDRRQQVGVSVCVCAFMVGADEIVFFQSMLTS
jgi:hypothetical protein